MAGFIVARLRSTKTPPTVELPIAAGGAWSQGALLLKDANGALAECGADPAAIAAVGIEDVGTDSGGYGGHGTKEFPPGYAHATKVQGDQQFHAEYIGTLPAADGGSYGVVKDSDGFWKVDFSDTTATRVKLVGRMTASPENRNRVLVVFLAANVQII